MRNTPGILAFLCCTMSTAIQVPAQRTVLSPGVFSSAKIEGIGLDSSATFSDNMQVDDDPLDWYVNGDTAPGARFNYIYTVEK
jgi:hypothetical protein